VFFVINSTKLAAADAAVGLPPPMLHCCCQRCLAVANTALPLPPLHCHCSACRAATTANAALLQSCCHRRCITLAGGARGNCLTKKKKKVPGKNNVIIFRVSWSILYLYLGRVLWASAAQLMSQQAKGLKELTTSSYVV
jgi:hypothetical protein